MLNAPKAIIHDFRPSCLTSEHDGHSILTLPVGGRYLVNQILDALRAVNCRDVHVVPSFEPDEQYWDRLCAAADGAEITVVAPDARGELLLDGESSDSHIMIDPRYVPMDGIVLERMMDVHREHFGATFVTDAGFNGEHDVEHVLLDPAGNVRRVQRVFDPLIWSQNDATIVPYCVIPHALAVHGPSFPLASMRRRLAARGVPMRDLPADSAIAYLNRREDLLRFACDGATTRFKPDVRGLVVDRQRPGAVLSRTATVAPTARFVGEVVVHAGARVGERATIIGPAQIGRGARIGDGAVVAQSLVMDHAVVDAGDTVHRQVAVGRFREPRDEALEFLRRPTATASDHEFHMFRNSAGGRGAESSRLATTLALKRVLDLVVGGALLIALAPLLVVVAVLVKLTSKGPAFFTHVREGRDGRPFGCIKFRTMRTDAHDLQRKLASMNEADGPQFVIRKDPRVTRLGAFLRRTNIDELPQLINVVAGHMSLVGPRPSPFRENQICAPWRRARLSVPPGMTGLWQICRYDRHEGDFHQWIYFDTAYVRNVSVWLDLKILWHTLTTGFGAWSVSVDRVLTDRARRDRSIAAAPASPFIPKPG